MSELQKNPPEGVKVFINDEDITDVQASIEGPGKYTDQLITSIYEVNIFNSKVLLQTPHVICFSDLSHLKITCCPLNYCDMHIIVNLNTPTGS